MRGDIVEMIAEAGSGHPGGSLSAADIVATLYFGDVLRHDAARSRLARARPLHPLEGPRRAGALRGARRGRLLRPRPARRRCASSARSCRATPTARRRRASRSRPARSARGSSISSGLALGLRGGRRPGASLGAARLLPARRRRAPGGPGLGGGDVRGARRPSATSSPSSTTTGCRSTARATRSCASAAIADKFAAFGWHVARGRRPRRGRSARRADGRARRTSASPDGDRRPHHQGQGRLVHGGQAGWHGKAPSAEQVAAGARRSSLR